MEQQLGVDPDPDEEEIEDVVLDNDRERHWRMVFQDNNGGVDRMKSLLHAKKWSVYNSQKEELIKGEYLVEVSDKDRKKVIQKAIDDRVVEEEVEHEELVL